MASLSHKISTGLRQISLAKVFLLFSLFLAFNTYAGNAYAEKTTFTYSLKNVSLKNVLRMIEEDSEFSVLYNSADVKGITIMSLNCEKFTINELLNFCTEDTHLDYEIKDKTIVIHPKKIISEKQDKQDNTITGYIEDKKGNPLPFASIAIEGSSGGCVSDINGEYILDIPSGNSDNLTIVASSIGFVTQKIKTEGIRSIDIIMQPYLINIDEVVVTGYQTISRERATGSFSVIDESVIDNKISIDFVSRLEGTVPGLQVDKYGGMTIRGTSTLNANYNPLVIVDGFPIEGDVNTVNPNDIKSVSILKDAAAASIWGARASNGVIVITTKQGKKNKKPEVNVSYNVTTKSKIDFSKYRYASAADQIDAELEAVMVGNIISPDKEDDMRAISRVANIALNSANFTEGADPYSYLTPDEITQIEQYKQEDGIKEFEDNFMRRALNQQANVSVNGATETVDYYITGIFDKQTSDFKREGQGRSVINSRLNIKLTDHIKLNNSVLFSQEKEDYSYTTTYNVPNRPKFGYGKYKDNDGNYNPFPSSVADEFKNEFKDNEEFIDWTYNPLQDFENTSADREDNNYRIQTGLDFEVMEGLTFSVKHQYESYTSRSEVLLGLQSYIPRSAYNSHTGFIIPNSDLPDVKEYVHSFPLGDILEYTDNKKISNTLRAQLNFDKEISQHSIKAIGGWEYRSVSAKETYDSYVGYSPQTLQSGLVDWKSINDYDIPTWNEDPYAEHDYTYEGPEFTENEERYVSFYANAGYTFADKYDFTISGRIDDSNLFGADKAYRIHPFWSVGGGWDISSEDFYDSNVLNYFKVRATYGLNGNIDRSTVPQMKAVIQRDYTTQDLSASIENPGNDNLRWEETAVANLGIDYGLFNSRISGYLEIYNKNSKDLLGQSKLHPITGYKTVAKNVANVSNKGFELLINTSPIMGDDFSWDLGFTFDYNKNTIEKVYQDHDDLFFAVGEPIYNVGNPIDAAYAFRWARLSDEGLPVMYNNAGEEVTYFENTGESVNEMAYIGASIAPINGSVFTTFSYKNLSLSMLFSGSFGHYFRMPIISYYNSSIYESDLATIETKDRWRNPGDEAFTQIPKMYSGTDNSEMEFFTYSDLRLKPADYISFQEITLTYSLIKDNMENLPFSNLTFMAYLTDIGKWVKNDVGIDPETVSDIYYPEMLDPTQFTFSLGVQATF